MRLLSVIMPVFNEARTFDVALKRVMEQPLDGWDKEVFVVDDGSQDGSLDRLAPWRERVHLVHHERNFGQGRALRSGIERAHGEAVVFQDADLEYEPAAWPRMLLALERDRWDAVYGTRTGRNAVARRGYWHYALGAWLLTATFNRCWGTRLTDLYTGTKLIRRAALEGAVFREDGFAFQVELTAHLVRRQMRIGEVPIPYHPRTFAEGKKISALDGVDGLIKILRSRWQK